MVPTFGMQIHKVTREREERKKKEAEKRTGKNQWTSTSRKSVQKVGIVLYFLSENCQCKFTCSIVESLE